MKFRSSTMPLSFIVFAFPGFAKEAAGAKDSLPCALGLEALYDQVLMEFKADKKLGGLRTPTVEYFIWQRGKLEYTFTRPSHPARPVFRRQRHFVRLEDSKYREEIRAQDAITATRRPSIRLSMNLSSAHLASTHYPWTP